MGRPKTPADQLLSHEIKTRVNDRKFEELQRILRRSPQTDMSALIRAILEDRPIKTVTRDQTLDNTMEELAAIRTEIKAVGNNINQITKRFHSSPEHQRKAFFANAAFSTLQSLEPKIDRLLVIISKLGKKWLSE